MPVERDRRDVLGRVMRESLAYQLEIAPSLLKGLNVDQAAAMLVRLLAIRHRLGQLERQLQAPAEAEARPERRDDQGRSNR